MVTKTKGMCVCNGCHRAWGKQTPSGFHFYGLLLFYKVGEGLWVYKCQQMHTGVRGQPVGVSSPFPMVAGPE